MMVILGNFRIASKLLLLYQYFRFDIPYTDDPDDSKLEVIVQLSQRDARSTLLSDQRQNLVIGFHIMKVEANRRFRVHRVSFCESLFGVQMLSLIGFLICMYNVIHLNIIFMLENLLKLF